MFQSLCFVLGKWWYKPVVTLFWTTYIAKEKNRCTEESLRKSKNMFFFQILNVYLRFSLNFYSVLLSTNNFFFTFSYSLWFQIVTLAPKFIQPEFQHRPSIVASISKYLSLNPWRQFDWLACFLGTSHKTLTRLCIYGFCVMSTQDQPALVRWGGIGKKTTLWNCLVHSVPRCLIFLHI